MPELIDIASGVAPGGLYPLLTASNFNTVALTAATASGEQSMAVDSSMGQVVGTGKRALFLWVDDWADLQICFYPISGAVGVACPSTTAWPYARRAGSWTDGRGMGILRFGLDPGRNFFRLLSAATCTAYWTDQAVA